MITARYSNGSLFVKFEDNDFIFQTCTKELAEKVVNLIQEGTTKETIYELLDPNYKKLVEQVNEVKEKNKEVVEIIKSITLNERFYQENGKLYRNGIPLAIPRSLAHKLNEVIQEQDTEQLDKLDKLWAWISLIKTPESRESIYSYIAVNKLPITKQGFVIGFRRANYVGNNKSLVEFVTKEYLRLRKNKKSTDRNVYLKDNEYSLVDYGKNYSVGNLKELFNSLSQYEDCFESVSTNHLGQRLQYRIGRETRLSDREVDYSPTECSRGIHLSHGRYDFYSYGDTKLAVAFNMADVVFAPYSDHSKMRVKAITPVAILENDCEFEITPEIEEIVDQMMIDHLKLLDNVGENQLVDINDHTLVQEVPDVNIASLFKVIKETVNPSIVKERYTKL